MELDVRNAKVYAYTGGKSFDPALPCVVFVHGAEGDHSVWGLQSRYLAHHGRAVLALDLPGHGRSAGQPLASIEAIADWIVEVLGAAHVPRAQIVGHSSGALVALEVAARHPGRVDRIALLGAAFPMRVSTELLEATRTDEPRALQMINIWSHGAYAHYPSSPGPGFWVHGANLRLMERQKRGVLPVDFAACNDYRGGLAAAAKVRCPTLFLIARRDLMTPGRTAQDLVKAIAGARVVEIDGSGHAMMAEKPDEVLDALRDFLSSAMPT
ncbi:MAG: alpha/beta hydrolase [Betaproteobacteria bacterium]|jgi:pimeloyl-ACP methyl ester carboxylesterase|nr:alpha/beta hydrolase [Betaproteobacteria bacterium]